MKIAVCIKSVPDPDYYDTIEIDPVSKTLVRTEIPTVINVADKHAIEAALRIKEQNGAEITVISMGPPNAKLQMMEGLAMGADRAFLLSDRKFGGADTLATSYTLYKVIEKTGPYDLILAGNESADGATSHVPSQLGEWLGIPHAANVLDIEVEDDSIVVNRQMDSGIGRFRLRMPCVAAANVRINDVRLTNAMAILKAKKKPYTVLTSEDFDDLDEKYIGLGGSPSQNGDLHTVEAGKDCVMIEADDETEAAQKVYDIIAPVLGLKGGR
jgi:electron transfer flavoprotein beta subunit